MKTKIRGVIARAQDFRLRARKNVVRAPHRARAQRENLARADKFNTTNCTH